jgi:putative flippase GtrA
MTIVAPFAPLPSPWWQRLPLARMIRCFAVSVSTTVLSMTILVGLVAADAMAPTTANIVATLAGIGPSYQLNRRYVWRRTGPGSWRREVLPFWIMNLLGLAVSTAAVAAAAATADRLAVSGSVRTIAVLGANATAFAALWLAQFFVLDRYLFARSATRELPS